MKKARKIRKYSKKKYTRLSQEQAICLYVRFLSKKYKIQYASM